MENSAEGPARAISIEAKFVVVLVVALVLGVWWLLSDREPTHKEMTFAYRKSVIAASGDAGANAPNNLREHLHEIELRKQRCDKLAERRYRCVADVLVDGRLSEIKPPADDAIYNHDGKGWRFESLGAH